MAVTPRSVAAPASFPQPFTEQDRTALTRAWIAVAEEYATETSTASLKGVLGRPGVFWDKVLANYNAASGNGRTAEELLTQWQQMLQAMTDFLELFQQKYFESRPNFRYDGACVGKSFKWATVEFRAKTGAEFPHVAAATQLTSRNKWWSVLKPLIALQHPASGEQEQKQDDDDEEEEEVLIVPGLQSTIGSKRTRSKEKEEGEDDEMDSRCVKQRVENDSPREVELPMTPFRPPSPAIVSPLPQKATHSNLDEVKLRKVAVMERRLELDIMTQREEGLSPEALEYLRWQRQQILIKVREEKKVATT